MDHLRDRVGELLVAKPSLEDRELLVQESWRPRRRDLKGGRRGSEALENGLSGQIRDLSQHVLVLALVLQLGCFDEKLP
jgi:hypothetical protein